MLVIEWLAKQYKIIVHQIDHKKLANDKTRLQSSRFSRDEQKSSNQEPRTIFHQWVFIHIITYKWLDLYCWYLKIFDHQKVGQIFI